MGTLIANADAQGPRQKKRKIFHDNTSDSVKQRTQVPKSLQDKDFALGVPAHKHIANKKLRTELVRNATQAARAKTLLVTQKQPHSLTVHRQAPSGCKIFTPGGTLNPLESTSLGGTGGQREHRVWRRYGGNVRVQLRRSGGEQGARRAGSEEWPCAHTGSAGRSAFGESGERDTRSPGSGELCRRARGGSRAWSSLSKSRRCMEFVPAQTHYPTS
jgi:hypothetical protein